MHATVLNIHYALVILFILPGYLLEMKFLELTHNNQFQQHFPEFLQNAEVQCMLLLHLCM